MTTQRTSVWIGSRLTCNAQNFWAIETGRKDPESPNMRLTSLAIASTTSGIVCIKIADKDLFEPPSSPSTTRAYIVGLNAKGAWAGHDSEIALYEDAAWVFHAPAVETMYYVEDESLFYQLNTEGVFAALCQSHLNAKVTNGFFTGYSDLPTAPVTVSAMLTFLTSHNLLAS